MPNNQPARTNIAIPLLATLTVCYLVGYVGSIGMMVGLGGWYQTLQRPTFSPPDWLFAPVWTVLYGLMGFALWTVWRLPASPRRTLGLSIFAIQLALNALWCWMFFYWQVLPLAFATSCLLALAVLASILIFSKLSARAAWLLVLCLAWAFYVVLFGFSIWRSGIPKDAGMPPVVRNSR